MRIIAYTDCTGNGWLYSCLQSSVFCPSLFHFRPPNSQIYLLPSVLRPPTSVFCFLPSALCPPPSAPGPLSSILRPLSFSNNKQPITNNKFYYFSFADWSRACSRTLAPASQSSHLVFSTSTWLRPPILGTNTMAVGHTWFM